MTERRTEADLEARIHAVMGMAFPWLPSSALQHQSHFSLKLGHTSVKVDGRSADRLSGRSDVLVFANDRPIAILELKRETVPLSGDDAAQGLSYARLTAPMTPLVVVSNGKETRIYITYSGDLWEPTERTEMELRQRLANVGRVAAADLKDAVDVLMESGKGHWAEALLTLSRRLLDQRSGGWREPLAPFVRNFLVPRQATALAFAAIMAGKRAVVLHGPPLAGKSSVLREFLHIAPSAKDLSVLIVEPSELGLFGAMASLLSHELGWTVSTEDAREWLRSISNRDGPILVIAIDGVDPGYAPVLADLNELASSRFGPALRLIAAVDDSVLDPITKKISGREGSSFGRIAVNIPLLPYDDAEFEQARKMLAEHQVHVTSGGESVQSLREPWILRALVPAEVAELPDLDPGLVVRIPPLLDIESLRLAANSIALDEETHGLLRLVADAVLDQYLDTRNSVATLHGISTFSVERRALENAVGESGIRHLRQQGYLKPGVDWAQQPVWFVRVPALVATHVATALADRIGGWGAPDDLARRMVAIAARLPLGDIIVAWALVQSLTRRIFVNPLEVLSALVQRSPNTTSLSAGSRFQFVLRGRLLEGTVTNCGKLVVSAGGKTVEIDLEESELRNSLSEPGGWLILSHVARVPLAIQLAEEPEPVPIDYALLMELAQAKIVLSRPDGDLDFKEVAVHDIDGHGTIVCDHAGVVEPVTWSLVNFFIRMGPTATSWIEEALATQSLALLARTFIALRQVRALADERGLWADRMMSEMVGPAIAASELHH
jgi:hypothetical protein